MLGVVREFINSIQVHLIACIIVLLTNVIIENAYLCLNINAKQIRLCFD